jgi:hypothetical protein
MLAGVAILILGPLGGVSAAFMNFSIGFFIGGQVLAKVFMHSYDVMRMDQFSHPHAEGAQQWQSAITYKIVGALKVITNPQINRRRFAGRPERRPVWSAQNSPLI